MRPPLLIATYPEVDERTRELFMRVLRELGDNCVIQLPRAEVSSIVHITPVSKYWQRRWQYLRRKGKAPQIQVNAQTEGRIDNIAVSVTV